MAASLFPGRRRVPAPAPAPHGPTGARPRRRQHPDLDRRVRELHRHVDHVVQCTRVRRRPRAVARPPSTRPRPPPPRTPRCGCSTAPASAGRPSSPRWSSASSACPRRASPTTTRSTPPRTSPASGQIRYGPAGASAARTLSLVVPCAELVDDGRQGATVDLALGSDFRDITPSAGGQRRPQGPHPGQLVGRGGARYRAVALSRCATSTVRPRRRRRARRMLRSRSPRPVATPGAAARSASDPSPSGSVAPGRRTTAPASCGDQGTRGPVPVVEAVLVVAVHPSRRDRAQVQRGAPLPAGSRRSRRQPGDQLRLPTGAARGRSRARSPTTATPTRARARRPAAPARRARRRARRGAPHPPRHRLDDRPCQRTAVDLDPDRHREPGQAVGVVHGAVDGVDHPAHLARPRVGVGPALLPEHHVVGAQRVEALPDHVSHSRSPCGHDVGGRTLRRQVGHRARPDHPVPHGERELGRLPRHLDRDLLQLTGSAGVLIVHTTVPSDHTPTTFSRSACEGPE